MVDEPEQKATTAEELERMNAEPGDKPSTETPAALTPEEKQAAIDEAVRKVRENVPESAKDPGGSRESNPTMIIQVTGPGAISLSLENLPIDKVVLYGLLEVARDMVDAKVREMQAQERARAKIVTPAGYRGRKY